MKSIYGELLDHYKEQKTKIGQQVYNVLNEEGIADIILSDNVFWFESYQTGNNCPEIVYSHIKKHLTKKGYKYLYELAQ